MRNRNSFPPAFAALPLVIALDCVNTCDEPQQPPAPPAHLLIKCAEASGGMPCWPDPAMLRLELPRRLPLRPPPEAEPPQIIPPR